MDQQLIKKMQVISPEEQSYLNGTDEVQKDIYTHKEIFEIDRNLFLNKGRLITVRLHSRFVDFPMHKHNYIEIMYVCKGTITHVINGKELVMEKGDLLLLNPHVSHSVKKAGFDDVGVNFIALPEFFDIPLEMLHERNALAEFLVETLRQKNPVPHYLLFRINEDRAIDNLMENMISSIMEEQKNADILNQYSMGLIFLYLLDHMDKLTQASSQSYEEIVVQTTLRYINHYYKNACLSDIARELNQSLSVLSKIIKRETGVTFQELLQRKKFQKAVMFLMDTELSIEEISLAVGYENYSFFYRQFRKRYGTTPRKYRIEHKNDTEIKL